MRTKGYGDYERFVALAFAGANMVVEIDDGAIVIYAAGEFQLEFGRPAESFLGQPLHTLVTPLDHEILETGLSLLRERGRLSPVTIRLANRRRTPLAIAGLALPVQQGSPRLCLSFAMIPVPLSATPLVSSRSLLRATKASLRTGASTELGLLEVVARSADTAFNMEISNALATLAPDDLAAEISPGRYGLLGPAGGSGAAGLLNIANLLEAALKAQGIQVDVASTPLPLALDGLSPSQAARALCQALSIFMRQGGPGLAKAGFAGGLAGYLTRAGTHTAALRRAIREHRFALAFQPIVSLADRSLHHYEALIRPEPVAGCNFAGPQEFILLIEALGLAGELDLEVAQTVCAVAAETPVPIAFNLSSQSIQDAGFRQNLLELLAPSDALKAGRLIVEMTETAEVENLVAVARTAQELRKLGVPFYLDDFGAGSSDVGLLRALNADVVKLDGSYLPGILQLGRERELIAGIVKIARGAGAEVLAERVETERECEELQALNVQYGQGFLFGRPGPLPEPARPARAKAAIAAPASGHRRGQVSGNWR